jgi:predicted phosphoribosyltransferase
VARVAVPEQKSPNWIAIMTVPYPNWITSGRELARMLRHMVDRDPLVLALPRGGVPVGYEVAAALEALLDLLLVRKLGVPGHEELAFGAIATGGTRVINEEVVRRPGIGDGQIEAVTSQERAEFERRARAYRENEPEPDVHERHIIVVDVGLATGATMRAGITPLRQGDPAGIIAAVPVGPPESVRPLAADADEVVCGGAPNAPPVSPVPSPTR